MFNIARLHRSRYGTSLRLNARTLLLLAGLATNGTTHAAQQTSPTNSRSQGEIVMINPFNPAYPPLARQANITGDVELKLEIRKDGTIQSAAVVSGHPMLTPAALNSAQRSHFECRGCEDSVTLGSVTYSFQIAASPGWPCPETNGARVTQSGNHIIVTAEPALVHIYFSSTAARSAKCLYLWACGRRWGGEDYYFYPVRSAKCLGLWNCGHQLREPFATCKELNRRLSY
jgi:TonB family protein